MQAPGPDSVLDPPGDRERAKAQSCPQEPPSLGREVESKNHDIRPKAKGTLGDQKQGVPKKDIPFLATNQEMLQGEVVFELRLKGRTCISERADMGWQGIPGGGDSVSKGIKAGTGRHV